MPGQGASEPEHEMPDRGGGVLRLTGVSEPTLTIFRATGVSSRTPAVIVCPGGGYKILAMNKEGSDIATWLNSLGITAFVLKYRVPDNRDGALQDIERAVRVVRSRQTEWNLDATKLGVMGFSAGGHLCAHLSTTYDRPAYAAIDDVDKQSSCPDFVVLVYPAYLGTNGQVSAELPVSKKIPPTLIVHSEDDKKFIDGSKIYDAALRRQNVPHEYLLFQTGGHGYGLQCQKEAKVWPERCREWLSRNNVLHEIGSE